MLSAVIRDDPKPLNKIRQGVPPELRRIVTRCLQKDSQARYPSSAALLQDLKGCRDLLFSESAATPERIVREIKRPRILIPLALVLVCLVTAGVLSVKHFARSPLG